MFKLIKKNVACSIALLLLSFQVTAAEILIDFELPDLKVSDYRKPYVAIWIEAEKKKETILLWHLNKRKQDKWLMDIRRWWRKIGRETSEYSDGVTGATKGPGKYQVKWNSENLKHFNLFIEVVREDGGRSIKRQAITISNKHQKIEFKSSKEIRNVTIKVGRKK